MIRSILAGGTVTTTVTASATDRYDASSTFSSISMSIWRSLLSSRYDSTPTRNHGGGGFDLPTPKSGGGGINDDNVNNMGGGGGVYPYPAGASGANAGTPWRSGFGHWYTTVYAGMILVPAALAAYI